MATAKSQKSPFSDFCQNSVLMVFQVKSPKIGKIDPKICQTYEKMTQKPKMDQKYVKIGKKQPKTA